MADIMMDMRGALRRGLYATRSMVKPMITVNRITKGMDR